MSYPVSGLGKPQNGGAFPIVEDVDFLGGFQVQATTASRDAIPLLNQKVGMQCYVIETVTTYKLAATGTPGTWTALPTGFTAGGDLGGSSSSQSVLKVNGVAISGTPSAGQIIVASSASAAAWGAAPSGFTAGGDLTGTSTSQTVAKVNGVAVTGTPTAGQVPTASSGTAAAWATPASGFTAGGDLSGTSTSQTVTKVNGIAITGTPASGYSLVATSGSAAVWTAPAATPTGTGFTHITAGARDTTAKLVDLVNDIVTSSVLPAANGGGPIVYFPPFTTTTATQVVVATSASVPAYGGVDVTAAIMGTDSSNGQMYSVVVTAKYSNISGALVAKAGPTPNDELTDMLGVSATVGASGTTVQFLVNPKASTTIKWTSGFFLASVTPA